MVKPRPATSSASSRRNSPNCARGQTRLWGQTCLSQGALFAPRGGCPLGAGLSLSLIHISEPTRLGMISYAVFCLKKKKQRYQHILLRSHTGCRCEYLVFLF